ncbi:type II toxin-antitoxin system RelE/ParE family toxin [Ekhidna sp.]|uniref:type II toxin-antitoxin system RelE/ParE family toxin n=1 Tax=Ekhidna sp. TaxID=2608089 RepID=UPI0032999A52
MDVYIDDKELEKLYTTGRSKKLKLPVHVVDKFLGTVQKIDAATSIHDFWHDKGLRFKKLEGEDIYSMRLNSKYRLEMEVTWENDEKTIGTFILKTISNHYDD